MSGEFPLPAECNYNAAARKPKKEPPAVRLGPSDGNRDLFAPTRRHGAVLIACSPDTRQPRR
jgi:hypothetical protein